MGRVMGLRSLTLTGCMGHTSGPPPVPCLQCGTTHLIMTARIWSTHTCTHTHQHTPPHTPPPHTHTHMHLHTHTHRLSKYMYPMASKHTHTRKRCKNMCIPAMHTYRSHDMHVYIHTVYNRHTFAHLFWIS